jgi:peptide chain release factor 2
MARPEFWADKESQASAVAELKRATALVAPLEEVRKHLADARDFLELGRDAWTEEVASHLGENLERAERLLADVDFRTMMGGEHDHRNAIVSIHAGAGGVESCDWARMLLRMYTRWMERKGFTYETIDSVPEPEGGIRSATLQVNGSFAFGYLQAEAGVHRLVRISPFDANARRHTSFASVDVAPEMDEIEIEIDEKELKIDTYRSQGAGGQHVNVTDSAVRITHLPTGIVVTCQNERSQHKNRAFAMKVLRGRLYRLEQSKREEELRALYGEKGEIAWGRQIRSYVLQPYQLVKDHRTEEETSAAEAVLDGEIDAFVEAYLRQRAGRRAASKAPAKPAPKPK